MKYDNKSRTTKIKYTHVYKRELQRNWFSSVTSGNNFVKEIHGNTTADSSYTEKMLCTERDTATVATFIVVSDVNVAINVRTLEAVTFMTMSDTNTSMW